MSWQTTKEIWDSDTLCTWCGKRYGEHFGKVCPKELYLQEKQPHDPISHPAHYNKGKIECIAAIEAALTTEEFRGYMKGNAIKYVWRENAKGKDEDLKKALWYLNRCLT